MKIQKYKLTIKKIVIAGLCAGVLVSDIPVMPTIYAAQSESSAEVADVIDAEEFYLHGSGKNIDAEEVPEEVNSSMIREYKTSFKTCDATTGYSYTTSDEGLALIKGFEGCRLQAYKAVSTEAYYTIGYGHYGPDVEEGMVITQEEADALFRVDLQEFEAYVNKLLNDYSIVVTQHQFDALVSFTYNCGPSWSNSSTIRTYLLNGITNYSNDQIIQAFSLWNTSGGIVLPGLTIRRRKEAAYFLDNMALMDYKTGQYTVAASSLCVRTGPDSSYPKATDSDKDIYYMKNDVVSIYEVQKAAIYTWGRGDFGWIMLDYCRFVIGSDTNLSIPQSEPTPEEPKEPEKEPEKETVKEPEKEPEKESTKEPEKEPEVVKEENYPTGFYQVTISELNIRSGPGTDYKAVKIAKKGELYHITKTSGRWGKTSAGWISLRADLCESYKPSKPVVSVKENTSSGVKLGWTAIAEADGYYVYRKTGTGSYEKIKKIIAKNTTSYTDTAAVNGELYQYKVFSYRTIDGAVCKSPASSVKTITYLKGKTLSAVSSTSKKKLKVKWESDEAVEGYVLQYSTSSSFNADNTKSSTIKSNETVTKTLSGLTSKSKYYVRVRTYKTVDGTKYYSAWSPKSSATIK